MTRTIRTNRLPASVIVKEVSMYKPCGKGICKKWLAKRGADPDCPSTSDCDDCEQSGPIQWWREQESMPHLELDDNG